MSDVQLIRSIASVFYAEFEHCRPFWIDFLGFETTHADEGIWVLARDEVHFTVLRDADYVAAPQPLYRIEVDDIHGLWAEIQGRHLVQRFAHPRFPDGPELRPWGAWEFAVMDPQVCLVFQQWERR